MEKTVSSKDINKNNYKQRLIELIKKYSFKYSEEPIFSLSSGKKSSFYFDLKKITYLPEGEFLIGQLLFEKIEELAIFPQAVGGLTMGADPIALAASLTSFYKDKAFSAFSIRKEAKKHGTKSQIEGNVNKNDKVVIVEDVVTTGGSTIKAIKVAEDAGLNVIAVIALLDRCENNGLLNIKNHIKQSFSILSKKDFKA